MCGALARANPEELKPVIENLCRALAAINGNNVDDGMPLQLPILAGHVRDYFGFERQMENLRHENLGDLGYFFKRSEATQHLDTGSIVALCNDQLSEPQPTGTAPGSTLYMVVSDDCVLIRAGRQPAEGEEGPSGSGHWVAWIGQVTTH